MACRSSNAWDLWMTEEPASRSPRCSRSPPTPPHPPGPGPRRTRAPLPEWWQICPPGSPARLPDRDLRQLPVHVQPDSPPPAACTRLRFHCRLPRDDHHHDRERVGETTPTDPRAQRNRAGRRGGHLLTRALSPPNKTGLPTLLHSRRPCPGRSHRRPTTPHFTSSDEVDGTGGAVVF